MLFFSEFEEEKLRKIAIISDTHGHLPLELSHLQCDSLFHAGDIGGLHILNELFVFDNFYAVEGNMDAYTPLGLSLTLKTTIEGIRFFLVHNLAAPHRIISTNREIIRSFMPHVVIFGHTHMPLLREEMGTIFLNPGSLGKRGLTGVRSYATMEIDEGAVRKISIIDFDSGERINSWHR